MQTAAVDNSTFQSATMSQTAVIFGGSATFRACIGIFGYENYRKAPAVGTSRAARTHAGLEAIVIGLLLPRLSTMDLKCLFGVACFEVVSMSWVMATYIECYLECWARKVHFHPIPIPFPCDFDGSTIPPHHGNRSVSPADRHTVPVTYDQYPSARYKSNYASEHRRSSTT